jgi:hypothetical protein
MRKCRTSRFAASGQALGIAGAKSIFATTHKQISPRLGSDPANAINPLRLVTTGQSRAGAKFSEESLHITTMYCKIFASLYQGTLRGRSDEILVFTNLLAHCDAAGMVDKHFRAIADETGLSVEAVKRAIEVLESPDEESRSPEHDGARIARMDSHRAWGWRVVNYGKYRAIKSEDDRREQNRLAQERWRKKQSQIAGKTDKSAPTVSNLVSKVSESKQDKPKEKKEGEGEEYTHTPPRVREADGSPTLEECEDEAKRVFQSNPTLAASIGRQFHALFSVKQWQTQSGHDLRIAQTWKHRLRQMVEEEARKQRPSAAKTQPQTGGWNLDR